MNLVNLIKQLGDGAGPVSRWLISGEVVPHFTAQHRSEICLECPRHNPDQTAAVLIGEGVRALLESKNKMGLKVESEDKLGTCEVCGCVVKLQVWEPSELLEKHTDRNLFPVGCWKK